LGRGREVGQGTGRVEGGEAAGSWTDRDVDTLGGGREHLHHLSWNPWQHGTVGNVRGQPDPGLTEWPRYVYIGRDASPASPSP